MSSAYGAIARPAADPAALQRALPLRYSLKHGRRLDVVQLALPLPVDSALFQLLRKLLNSEIRQGNTYPQEQELDDSAFAAYFFSSNAFVAVVDCDLQGNATSQLLALSASAAERVVAGMFYIKPNYPGRSSHICNGGFVTSSAHRGLGVGTAMGRAFLILAPLLGYRASVFNLVYRSNAASVQLWRSLGFTEIGVVPLAGRLKSTDQGRDEYVDAIVFYYDFARLALSSSKL
ncbi:hypothetical protein RI367_004939 [Sorochytrium milnesiophthora]